MKILKPIFLVILFSMSFTLSIYAADISSYEVKEFSNNTSVTGKLPEVKADSDILTKLINAEVKNIYTNRSNAAKNSNAKSVTFSYDVYEEKNVTSIVIESKVSKLKSITSVDTIVFDSNKIYTLPTYLNSTQLKLFNKSINEQIKQNPKDYKVSEVTLSEKTSFYIKNGVVYAAFDGETVASSTGITTFAYKSTSTDNYVLKRNKYVVQSSTQAKFVPIREVYTNLGYNVKYKDKQIIVTDDNGKKIATFEGSEDVTVIPQNKSSAFSMGILNSGYRTYIVDGVSYTTLATVQSTTNAIYEINSNGDIIFTIPK